MIVLLAALLSGAMFYLSQGLDDLWLLAWLAPAPLLWLAYGKTQGWRLFLVSAAATLGGLIYVFQCYGALPPLLLLEIMVPQVVLFPMAIAFARKVQHHSGPLATLLAFPACWTAIEFLISLVSRHGSFGSLAYSQVSAPLLIQCASLFGLHGVTFLICLFANTIAIALRALRETLAAVALGLAVCTSNVVFGLVRLDQPRSEMVGVAALVDESASSRVFRDDTLAAAVNVSEAYGHAIRKAAAEGAQLAVTPEVGILSKAQWRSSVLSPLLAASRETGIRIVAGVYEPVPPGNMAFSIGPGARIDTYAKRHLVPVLEAQLTPGRGSGWLGDGQAMEICKDMDFPRTIRRDAGKGVRLMAVPAADFVKDAWLHGRMAIMRGVEDGFAVVRAANRGLLTVSDAQGRLIAAKTVAPAGMTMIISRVALGPGPTFYTRIGDAFEWMCVVIFLLVGARVGARRFFSASSK